MGEALEPAPITYKTLHAHPSLASSMTSWGSLKLATGTGIHNQSGHSPPYPRDLVLQFMAGGGPPSDSDTHARLRTLGHTKLHNVGSDKRDFFKTSPICQDIAAAQGSHAEKHHFPDQRDPRPHFGGSRRAEKCARVCPGGLHPPTWGRVT